MSINSDLLERLYAIHSAFATGVVPPIPINPQVSTQPKPAGHWRDALQSEDEDEGGGRGTAKGLRGKDAAYAKEKMRRLTRTR